MSIENFYTVFATIKRNPDGSFDRSTGGKQVKVLEKWQDATKKTQIQIDNHFKNYDAAIALVTGKKNGITVIDFDSKDNELAMELFMLAPTKTVETEKGSHFYYKYCSDPEIYTKANAFGEGVDCRNDGGFIFCPPTPNYIPKEDPMGELTSDAIALLKSKAVGKKRIDLLHTTTRNDDLFRKACGWIDHYDEKEVWSKMVRANKEFLKGSLDEKELDIIYQQVLKYKKTGQKVEDKDRYKLILLENVVENVNDEVRYTTGIKSLDEAMRDEDLFNTDFQGGFALGEFIAIAGRPGNGKTLLAAQITTAIQKQGVASLWFSYEAKNKKLKRIFKKQGANLRMIASIDIDEKIPMLGNVNWLEYYIKQAVEEGVKMVVIDNLDFLETRNDREAEYSMNQQAFLHSIVSELAKIALQYNIILILIAHVRKPQQTGYKVKRPFLYDIAGTSAVERLCSFGLIVDREVDTDENFSNRSFVYLDKNRESGVRKKITLEYKNGKLEEEGSELLKMVQGIIPGCREVNNF